MVLRDRFDPIVQGLGSEFEVTVLNSGSSSNLLPDVNEFYRMALQDTLDRRNGRVINGRVNCVHSDEVVMEVEQDNDVEIQLCSHPFAICWWASGAHPHSLSFRVDDSGVALSDRAWIRVAPKLQTVS